MVKGEEKKPGSKVEPTAKSGGVKTAKKVAKKAKKGQ